MICLAIPPVTLMNSFPLDVPLGLQLKTWKHPKRQFPHPESQLLQFHPIYQQLTLVHHGTLSIHPWLWSLPSSSHPSLLYPLFLITSSLPPSSLHPSILIVPSLLHSTFASFLNPHPSVPSSLDRHPNILTFIIYAVLYPSHTLNNWKPVIY